MQRNGFPGPQYSIVHIGMAVFTQSGILLAARAVVAMDI